MARKMDGTVNRYHQKNTILLILATVCSECTLKKHLVAILQHLQRFEKAYGFVKKTI